MRSRRLHGAERVQHLVQHLVGVLAGQLLGAEEVLAAAHEVGVARMSADVRGVVAHGESSGAQLPAAALNTGSAKSTKTR
jgi:predicted membrane protein